jgi:glutamine synthetase
MVPQHGALATHQLGAGQAPQGKYYCGVGADNVSAREIVEKHLDICLEAGLSITGINAEVLIGQWEFQIFGKGSRTAADQIWVARYILLRLCESYGIDIEWHCKPLGDTDWNGSGMHCNFSTKFMRETGGKDYFERLMKQFDKNLHDHIKVYGPDNHLRLTGKHETAPWNKFSYGIADRGASVRVPHSFANNGYKGYLEDRRPNSQGCPYRIASQVLKTISEVPTA